MADKPEQSTEVLTVRVDILKEMFDDLKQDHKDRHSELANSMKTLAEKVDTIDKRQQNFETRSTTIASIVAFFASTLINRWLP